MNYNRIKREYRFEPNEILIFDIIKDCNIDDTLEIKICNAPLMSSGYIWMQSYCSSLMLMYVDYEHMTVDNFEQNVIFVYKVSGENAELKFDCRRAFEPVNKKAVQTISIFIGEPNSKLSNKVNVYSNKKLIGSQG